MSNGVVAAMARAYRDPRGAMAAQITAGLSEVRGMVYLFLGCGLAFVASLPNAIRAARGLSIEEPLAGAVSAHLFGYFFIAPLLLYGLAAGIHLIARLFGARGGFLSARVALFWSVLLGGPIAMALAMLGMIGEAAFGGRLLPLLGLAGYAGLAFWLWLFAATLAEAEGFSATGRVAAVLAVVFAGVALSVTLLTQGLPVLG